MSFIRATAVAVAVAALAAPATAATISFSDSIALTTTNWSDSFDIQRFDPLLGTLTSITFQLSGTVTGNIRAESMDNAPSTVSTNLQATITLTRPDTTVLAVVLPVASFINSFTAFDGTVDFGGTSGVTQLGATATSATTTVSPPPVSDLALFTGIGSILLPAHANGSSNASGSGNLITQFQTNAEASVTVTYTYTTATIEVPEPASLALFGAGLLGLGLVRRRRA